MAEGATGRDARPSAMQDGIRLFRSSGFRLTLLSTGAGIAALLLFAAVVWFNASWRLGRELDAVVAEQTRDYVALAREDGVAALRAAIAKRVAQPAQEREILLLADHDLTPLAGNLLAWPAAAERVPGWYDVRISRDARPVRTRLLVTALPDGSYLLVGRDLRDVQIIRVLFFWGLAGAAAVVLLVGLALGTVLHLAFRRRVEAFNRTTSAIMQGDLSRRLPAVGSEELDYLAATINRMLDQIEHLIDGVRNVSNAIAHDLRTPLAELRVRLEELSRTRPDAPAVFTEIDGAVADIDRLIATFNALLRLAELESGARRAGFVAVDLAAVAAQAVELYEPMAEARSIALQFAADGAAVVQGDPYMLAQSVANLIENALKFGPRGGEIVVSTGRSGDAVEMAVADHGPGIADTEKRRVTERFYRGDASRGTPGLGLGLSLVAAVARLHGGDLVLADNHPGLRATLRFSTTSAAAPI